MERAKRIVCLANQKAIAVAYVNYATAHDGLLVSSFTRATNDWCLAGNSLEAIRNGLLYPYVNDVRPYRCSSPPPCRNLPGPSPSTRT